MTRYLITGASGQLGRLVIKHLLETEKVPATDIVAGTRDPGKLTDLAEKGVEIRKVDFDDAAGLPEAFKGVDRMLIISTDRLDVPGKRLAQIETAAKAAAQTDLKRIAYTSMPKPETSAISFAYEHLGSEKAVIATGIPYTILRNNWYMENLFMGLPQAIAGGTWYTSAGDGGTAYIAREDCARGAAAALVRQEDGNVIYTLTGASAVSNPEIAALAAKATGRKLEVVQLDDAAFEGGLKHAGLPDFLIPFLVSVETATRNGDLAIVTSDFEKLTGRKPAALDDFLVANTAALKG